MTKTVFERIAKNIEGIALAVVTTWGSSGAFVFQSLTKRSNSKV